MRHRFGVVLEHQRTHGARHREDHPPAVLDPFRFVRSQQRIGALPVAQVRRLFLRRLFLFLLFEKDRLDRSADAKHDSVLGEMIGAHQTGEHLDVSMTAKVCVGQRHAFVGCVGGRALVERVFGRVLIGHDPQDRDRVERDDHRDQRDDAAHSACSDRLT